MVGRQLGGALPRSMPAIRKCGREDEGRCGAAGLSDVCQTPANRELAQKQPNSPPVSVSPDQQIAYIGLSRHSLSLRLADCCEVMLCPCRIHRLCTQLRRRASDGGCSIAAAGTRLPFAARYRMPPHRPAWHRKNVAAVIE